MLHRQTNGPVTMNLLLEEQFYDGCLVPLTCFNASHLCKPQRVRHGQIPVQRYAAEEGDADVDICVEDEAEQLAALLPVDPVVMMQEVVDPQRESGDVQEVGHRQVDQVDAQFVALAHLEERMRRW